MKALVFSMKKCIHNEEPFNKVVAFEASVDQDVQPDHRCALFAMVEHYRQKDI